MQTSTTIVLAMAIGALAALSYAVLARGERRRAARERRLSDLRSATARMVHQARNPVQSILLHADLLGDPRTASDPRARADACEAIVSEAQRLAAMLHELSEFSTGGGARLELQSVPLRELVREISASGANDAPRVELETDLEVTVPADPYFLRQALESILANAREAVKDQEHPRIVARIATRARLVELDLADNGPGIPPDRLDRVFEPFASWTPGRLGLGLTTAREIVERHGGGIEIESEPGAGTRVRIRLPGAPARVPLGGST